MNRKFLPLFLALTITATFFAGCSGKKEASQPAATPAQSAEASKYGDTGGLKLPIVSKPTTISWMLVSDVQGLNDKDVIKELETRTGVKLDLQTYPTSSYKDKLKITLASGKYPDIMYSVGLSELNSLGSQGAFAPINKYADQLPNFKKLYMDDKNNNWVMKSFTDDKGNIYTWPTYGVNRDVNHGFLYRKDIFDKNGIKEWTNTDEFYQALKKLKQIYPNSTPLVSKTKEGIFKDYAYGWGIGSYKYPGYYDEKTKTWKLATVQNEFKGMLDFLKKLYNEGLLDPEFMTDTQASWTAKMAEKEKAFVTFDWISRTDMFYAQVKGTNPEYNLRYGNPVGPTGNIRTLPKINDFGIAVSNNDNKEAALKLLDYITSPSGSELITLGVEGKDYNLENNKPVYAGLKGEAVIDINVLAKNYGAWLEGMYLKVDPRSVYFNYTEKEQEAQDKINKAKKYEAYDPILKFTNEENSSLSELQQALDKAGSEFAAKYVLDKSYGDAQWKEWQSKAEKLGYKKYEEILNTAQARYDSAK